MSALSEKLRRTSALSEFGAVALWVSIAAGGCSGPDIVEKNLSDMAEARESGVLKEGGWLPGFLPANATNIRLRYDVDTNEIWVGFDRRGPDLSPMEQSCNRVERGNLIFPRKAPTIWWPDELKADAAASRADYGFEFHKCSDGGFVAATGDGKRSYYWFRPTDSG